MSEVLKKMFSSYDLRGVVPVLNANVYYWMGKSLVEDILTPDNLSKEVVVGYDCRLSSPEFSQALMQGISDAGGSPRLIGLCSTDQLYAALRLTQTAGCMVTASHNPKEYNGCKIVKKDIEMLGIGNGLEKVRDAVISHFDELLPPIQERSVDTELRMEMESFLADVLTRLSRPDTCRTHRIKKIVVDAGNGSGGQHFAMLKQVFPMFEWLPLHIEPDGHFPHHMPDPTKPSNLLDLQARMGEVGADLGIAFDGDADRAYFLDENRRFIDSNSLVALLGARMVRAVYDGEFPDFEPAVVYNFPGSRGIPYTVLEANGIPVPSKMGHTFIKRAMSRYGAIFGGEHSGHFYFGPLGGFDSGILTVGLLLRILSEEDASLSQFVAPFQNTYFWSGEINYPRDNDMTIDMIRSRLTERYPSATINTLDGISVFMVDWKVNLRFSNTEPILRMSCESIGNDQIHERVSEIRQLLNLPDIEASSH